MDCVNTIITGSNANVFFGNNASPLGSYFLQFSCKTSRDGSRPPSSLFIGYWIERLTGPLC